MKAFRESPNENPKDSEFRTEDEAPEPEFNVMQTLIGARQDRNVTAEQQEILLEIMVDPFYSEANQSHLKRAIADLDAGKGHVHELLAVDDE